MGLYARALARAARDDLRGLLGGLRALGPVPDAAAFARLVRELNSRRHGPADAAALFHALSRAGALAETEGGDVYGRFVRPVTALGGPLDAARLWRMSRASPDPGAARGADH